MYVKSMYPDPPAVPATNVHNMLFQRQDQRAWTDHTIHIDAITGKKRSFREFYEQVIDGATALGSPVSEKGLGLRGEDGEIVGILSENCMDYITLVHSLLAITTPFTMFSSYYTPFELAHAIRLSKATRIFVQPKYLALVQRAAKDVGFPDNRIYNLNGQTKDRLNFEDMIRQTRKGHLPTIAVRPAKKDTLAYLIFSSGTSGLPKAVMISHGNLIYTFLQAMVTSEAATEVYTPPAYNTPEGIPVTLGFLPMHHTYGLHAYCFRTLLAQVTTVLLPQWEIGIVHKLIPRYRITHLSLIPSLVHQLVNHPKTEKADLSSLVFVTSGAAYLPDHLASKLKKLVSNNVVMTEAYGMSEATVAICSKPFPGALSGRAKNVPGSSGILLAGVEARILREDGSDAPPDEPGELWIRSECVAMGYWDNPEATKATFVDGWLRTGDMFLVDADGVFYFQDRAKDTLKVSGMQVSPVEIENTLLAHPDKLIVDASVAGVSGGRTSDEKIPRAWVVLSEAGRQKGEAAVIKALDAWSKKMLSKYKRLRGGIEIVDEIPKSPTGKVLRRVLQDEYDQRMKKPNAKL